MEIEMSAQKNKSSEWLESWDPNAEGKWESKIAWKTLWVTTYALTLGFMSWFLVSALAPKLNNLGFDLSKKELYWLAAMPGLAGGGLRLIWMLLTQRRFLSSLSLAGHLQCVHHRLHMSLY
jgi:NNP family nitrate/nitrite transporter-like MFS transporter